MAVRREVIADYYRDILGREGSEGEISGWENAPDENAVRDMFLGSPEHAAQTGGQATWQDVGGTITPMAQLPQSQSPYQVQGDRGDDSPTFPGGGVIREPSTTPTPTTPITNNQAIIDFYKNYLGRDPIGDDVSKWLSGAYGWGDANNLAGIQRGIQTSEEAARRRAATPTTSYSTTPYSNFQSNGNDYSAFNTGRQQDPAKSAKDRFVQVTNSAPPPPTTRAQMPAWFNTYIRPGFEASGNTVLSVDGDSFTYSNHQGTFRVDYFQNADGNGSQGPMRLQWGATPADAATTAKYAGSSSIAGPAASSGASRSSGSSGTVGNLRDLYTSLGQQYGGPGGAGITNGPLQQVGQDPLSYLITGALANFLGAEGSTTFGGDVQAALAGLLERGGDLDNNQVARRYESARELLDKGRRTMIGDMRGDLAERNLLSEPGIPQGAEIGGLERITERLAPEFSRALRDIYSDETAKSDARMMTALQLATGFSTDQARNLLAGIGEGTARQTQLADIALRSLQTNMAWSQFLAQFGLERDKVMYEIQNGNIEQMLPLLQAFIQMAGLANQGYV